MGIILLCRGPNALYEMVNDIYTSPLTSKIVLITVMKAKKFVVQAFCKLSLSQTVSPNCMVIFHNRCCIYIFELLLGSAAELVREISLYCDDIPWSLPYVLIFNLLACEFVV